MSLRTSIECHKGLTQHSTLATGAELRTSKRSMCNQELHRIGGLGMLEGQES